MDPETVGDVDQVPHGSSDDPCLLDFSANINPIVPEGTERVYREAFEASRTYPPEPPARFRAAAGEYIGVSPDTIVPTPGGLAAIRLVVGLTVTPGDSALLPAPSFGEYEREVRLQGGDPVFVDEAAILSADPTDHALAIVCNPNNPTGRAYDHDALQAFAGRCREADTTLLVDEAFLGFTERTTLAGTDGVVVARSLTKLFGLPGLRAGFAVTPTPDWNGLPAARRPWNVGRPALSVGTYCLRRSGYVTETRERVRSERRRLREKLTGQYDVSPSEAPFLLLDVGDRDVETVLQTAENAGVALRDATTFRGLDSHVRIAVRLPEENDELLEVLTGA